MFDKRGLAKVLLVLGAILLAFPAVTLAGGGGSAGDQQYTDPFGASSTKTATSAPAPTTTSAPAQAQAQAPTTSTGSPSDEAAARTTAAPTATIASPATSNQPTNASSGSATSLPYTGYDSWAAGCFGLALLLGGLALRRRTHSA